MAETPEPEGKAQQPRLPDRVANIEDTLLLLVDRFAALEAEVREFVHDLSAVAEELGRQLGEPFRSRAREIVSKRQTP